MWRHLSDAGVTTIVGGNNAWPRMSATLRLFGAGYSDLDSQLDMIADASHLDIYLHLLCGGDPRPMKLQDLLYIFLNGQASCPTTLALVGGGEACRGPVGADPTVSREEFYDAIDTAFNDLRRPPWSERPAIAEALDGWRECIRFLTPEEYEAEVGAAQVALETRANPYTGPPVEYMK
jgi:hypothetical protein